MIKQKIPIFGEEEAQSCYDYIKSGGFLTEFKKTQEFEKLICEYTGSKHCIVTTSGTAALYILIKCLELNSKSSIVVPNLTMIATPNAVEAAGHTVILCDVDHDSFTLDFDFKSKPDVIIHVSLNGRAGNIFKLKKYCEENNIILIEDAAQSLGSFVDGKHLGTIGKAGIISFSPPKIISTGQGGAIITDDDDLALKIRKFKDFGRERGGHDIHDEFGLNFKFTDLQSCVGVEQMRKLDGRVEKMKQIHRWYKEYGIEIEGTSNQEGWTPWFIEYKTNKRDELQKFLKEKNIETRSCYPPISSQKIYSSESNLNISKEIANKILWLPSSVNLTREEVEMISIQILQ
jgi:perosamine synthetase